eukprot:6196984-Pleurochrysis_carterae.AAC.2
MTWPTAGSSSGLSAPSVTTSTCDASAVAQMAARRRRRVVVGNGAVKTARKDVRVRWSGIRGYGFAEVNPHNDGSDTRVRVAKKALQT